MAYDFTTAIPTPEEGFLGGFRQMGMIQDARAKAEAERQAAIANQQMNRDLMDASGDITKVPALMVRYPQLAEKLKFGLEAMTEAQQSSALQHSTEVLSALDAGRPDVAAKVLRSRAEAMRNAGDERGAKTAEDMAQWAETDPGSLLATTAGRVLQLKGGDKIVDGIIKRRQEGRAAEQAPFELRTKAAGADNAESDAKTAKIDADLKSKYGEQTTLLDIQKKGWDIKAIQEDIEIKKQANRIAAMNAATAREGNSLKLQELKLKVSEAQQKLDEKVREKVSTAESGAAQIDNMLNTVERIKKNKSLDSVIGAVQGRMPVMVSDEASDAVALIETLGSQAFLAQIPNIKGMGALSNAEGEKLQSALTALTRVQSEGQFRANLDEASRLLNKGRENLSRSTGVPLGKPDTPAKPGARPPLDSFNR